MNLIAKTTLFYLLVAVLVFGIGGWVTYHVVKTEVTKETDFQLYDEVQDVANDVRDGIPIEILRRRKVGIEHLGDHLKIDTFYRFSDTLAPHPYRAGEMEPYRKLEAVKEVDGSFYHISITDVFIESDDIYDVVVEILWRLFLILGVGMLIASFLVTRWLLTPFQRILSSIRGFNIKQPEPLDLPATSTKEFRQLNAFVSAMTERARRDFRSVREFSENASHEMQTPLSIARGKLELLQETQDLDQEQLRLINDAQNALRRLSKLGSALLLLTKIENHEFRAQREVDISAVVNACLDNFSELAMLRGLPVKREVQPDVGLAIDPTLADVLVSNLVRNAIRHNQEDGAIEVKLDKQGFSIRNTGAPPSIPTADLFKRFRKNQQSEKSMGLGLAIVKKICDTNQLEVGYDFQDGWHEIKVKFPINV
ncbi:MAG: histidine kinase dimerization/phospho-acceptor domain-containing protein [Phaeodactylibacter sp.]|uniref:sensor histidine kinase n=1 Tax=Phaeodactylibacter sp. TaxID=1940289 RepID=UPI0032ED3B96